MKLLVCKKCSDVFNLTSKLKTCSCGKSAGLYMDEVNAQITGDCQPIGFDNGSLLTASKMQVIEDRNQPPIKSKECCPQGVRFEAFFIPAVARSIERVDEIKTTKDG